MALLCCWALEPDCQHVLGLGCDVLIGFFLCVCVWGVCFFFGLHMKIGLFYKTKILNAVYIA